MLAKIEAAGLTPNPEADRRALIRRVSLDLTGLPPRPEDVAAFVADTAPDAYDQGREPAAVVPALRRAPRALLARCGSLRRHERPSLRQLPRRHLAVSRLGHRRPSTATCRSIGSPSSSWPAICCRTRRSISGSPPGSSATTPPPTRTASSKRRSAFSTSKDRADTTGTVFLGLTVGCATLPRPQVRSDFAEGPLRARGVLQQHDRAHHGQQPARPAADRDRAARCRSRPLARARRAEKVSAGADDGCASGAEHAV